MVYVCMLCTLHLFLRHTVGLCISRASRILRCVACAVVAAISVPQSFSVSDFCVVFGRLLSPFFIDRLAPEKFTSAEDSREVSRNVNNRNERSKPGKTINKHD